MQLKIENILYDYNNGLIRADEKEIKLTKLQRNLLNYLIDNPNHIITKQAIMEKVWGRIITENSIDQVISVLRNHLEIDSSKPKIIVTHFGKGISFEGKVTTQPSKANSPTTKKAAFNKLVYLFIPLFILALIWIYQKQVPNTIEYIPEIIKNQRVLILPTTFLGHDISDIEQNGMKDLLKSTFLNLDSEGQMVFDETSLTTKQAIEKHWRLENNLIVIRSQVEKVGNTYNSVIHLSNGLKVFKTEKLSANNLNDLLNSQIDVISNIEKKISKHNNTLLIKKSPSQSYIEALGFKNNGDYEKAKELIEEILKKQADYYQARLTLAEILFIQKDYDKSRSQLETLKSTPAYQSISTEIELKLAEIKFVKNDFSNIINDLKSYQLKNPNISEIKKSKIKLRIAQCYFGLGDLQNARDFYQNAIVNLDEQLNPSLYAQSFFGRGIVELSQSNGQDVYQLFEKSLEYAQLSGDVHHQVIALNEMAGMLFSSFDWDKGIEIQKRAIDLMELEPDQSTSAKGLGVLVAVLNQRGHFKDATIINEKLGKIANETDSSLLQLHYLHYKAVIAMNTYKWQQAQLLVDQHLKIANETKNYAMQLDNAFLELEIRLLKKDINDFEPEWNRRTALIKEIGFERFQTYMDLYLARYYKQMKQYDKAVLILKGLTEKARATNDIKFIVDAQNQLAMVYLQSDAKKALVILNDLEQYNPHPNPYLDLKAQALHKMDENIEALNVLNQAKLVYNESWTAENQALYETITNALK